MGKKALSVRVQSGTKYTLVRPDESSSIESAYKTRKQNVTQKQFLLRKVGFITVCFLFFYVTYTYGILLIPKTKFRSSLINFQHLYDVLKTSNSTSQKYLIKTEGCSILYMDPFDESVKKYYHTIVGAEKKQWECPNMDKPLLKRNSTHIWILKENKSVYKVSDKDDFICCYQPFYRFDLSDEDIMKMKIDYATIKLASNSIPLKHRVKYGICVNFTESIKAINEYVRVTCFSNGTVVHMNLFIFGIKKNNTESYRKINYDKLKYNVVIIGLDSISRLNFHRTMPKTLNYLKEMGAVELLGYTKIGWNTYPNIAAMLMGLTETEMTDACDLQWHSTLDFCPFVWTWYKQAGFFTAYAEDTIQTFHEGFFTTPTDYYRQTFTWEVQRNQTNKACIQENHSYLTLLEYAEEILWSVRPSTLFGFFWESTMTHFDLNAPTLIDDNYFDFFNRLNTADIFNNTIFFIVSDHGLKQGDIRTTEQGRIEERSPMAYILTPPSFRNTFGVAFDNLRLNAKRLTSPYDIHETLLDLIDLDSIKNDSIKTRHLQIYEKKKGISLFLPIPGNRTCKTAGIDNQWCTCTKGSKKVIKNPEYAQEVGKLLVEMVNSMVSEEVECANFTLEQVMQVNEERSLSIDPWHSKIKNCLVLVRTQPGGAMFEGTMHFDGHNWSLADKILRMSPYGYQSWCIANKELKPFCFCKQNNQE